SDLAQVGVKTSRATIMRKIKAYREGGAGLADGRSLRERGPLDAADSTILEVLNEVMAEQADRSTITKKLIIRTALQRLTEQGLQAHMPSQRTMYRYFDLLDRGRHTAGAAITRRSIANVPDRLLKKTWQTVAGAEVQVDTTPMDVLVRTELGAMRPELS